MLNDGRDWGSARSYDRIDEKFTKQSA